MRRALRYVYDQCVCLKVSRALAEVQIKEVYLVKVLWNHHDECVASWELESDMRARYPQLFV